MSTNKKQVEKIDDIDGLLEEKENELVNAKLQHSLNKLKKTHILKKIRKEIAVLLTKKTLQESEVR